MINETQASIHDWSREIFGPWDDLALFAARINQEMAELVRILCRHHDLTILGEDTSTAIADEAADLVIMLCSLGELVEFDLLRAVDRKMEINRARDWKVEGDGFGHHTEPGGAA